MAHLNMSVEDLRPPTLKLYKLLKFLVITNTLKKECPMNEIPDVWSLVALVSLGGAFTALAGGIAVRPRGNLVSKEDTSEKRAFQNLAEPTAENLARLAARIVSPTP